MYQQVRTRLTALFSLATCTLLLILLSVSFYLSYHSQLSLQLANFTRQSVLTSEEAFRQNVITTEWLNAKEKSSSFYLFLLDHGTPIFHNSIQPADLQRVFEDIRPYLSTGADSKAIPLFLRKVSEEYEIYLSKKGLLPEYLIATQAWSQKGRILQIFIIQPFISLHSSLRQDLVRYLILFLIGGGLLVLFCWHFTGILLRPLKDARESQNRFVSNASHELRTPLAVILANASACRNASREQQNTFFDVIEHEGRQMSQLLEQLLTLSRADSHGLTMQMEETDLQTLLLEVYEAFYPLAWKEEHPLMLCLPEEEIPTCCCDMFRMEQAINILLQNALSYTPKGCKIILSLTCEKNRMILSVQDQGSGIPDWEKNKIFERFYRGKNHLSSDHHHGLGLPVAKEIAHLHGGTLRVLDAPGGGALFQLEIPQFQ